MTIQNLDDIIAQLESAITSSGAHPTVEIAIVTNQDNGIVSYATGTLSYIAPAPAPVKFALALGVFKGQIEYVFSDRFGDVVTGKKQPFTESSTEKSIVSINLASSTRTLHFQSVDGSSKVNIPLTPVGNILQGISPHVGNKTTNPAVLLVSFYNFKSNIIR